MAVELEETFPTDVEFIGVYVIYSADILGREDEIEGMGPFRKAPEHGAFAKPFPGEWVQTEGDDQYEYEYLVDDDRHRAHYLPAGEVFEGADPDDERFIGEGRHRKWVAELTIDEWREVADALCIGLHPNGVPIKYGETLGSITEHGRLAAVAVDNTEGWSPIDVIDSNLYVSFATEQESE